MIGEAANTLTPECRASLPDIPWREIIGLRHRLIHGYLEVNLDTVWQVVERDLPALDRNLRAVVEPALPPAVKRTGRKRARKTSRGRPRRAA